MEKRFKTPDGGVFTLYELRKVAEVDEMALLEEAEAGDKIWVSYFYEFLECIL